MLANLLEWARDPSGPRIFHLTGGAGMGKTAIAATFVRLLHRHGLLGGSYFYCRSDEGDDRLGDYASDMFPTVSDSLASVSPTFRSARAPFLGNTPYFLEDQFSVLVDQPAQSSLYRATASTLIIVIDAFDESDVDINTLLNIIAKPGPSHSIKYMVTSRIHKDIRAISDSLNSSGMVTLILSLSPTFNCSYRPLVALVFFI